MTFSDGTKLQGWIQKPIVVVEATGLAASVAEVGEQLAWLGASLRPAPEKPGLALATPIITYIGPSEKSPDDLSQTITCEISFVTEPVEKVDAETPGRCWHDAFLNPIIVQGYPIPQRFEWNTGLEIPLNVMIGLARARGVDEFNDNIYIKGFSTLIIPRKQEADMLYWHMLFNADGSRISYLNHPLAQVKDLKRLNLGKYRHVLGWCLESELHTGKFLSTFQHTTRLWCWLLTARKLIGSYMKSYPIDYARLPIPQPNSAFASMYLELRQLRDNSQPFVLGSKDTPDYVHKEDYILRMDYIKENFVLLWDEDDKRGWLVNGTTALLHVLRAWLDESSKNHLEHSLKFKNSHFKERTTRYSTDAAFDVLTNPANFGCQLYEASENSTLKSRIEYYSSIFEKLFELQDAVMGRLGENLCTQPRSDLEGWDFSDLVTMKTRLDPCIATLESAGKCWVDFMRSLSAITLIGRAFGEMIKPTGSGVCGHWTKLPTQKYHIASTVLDLKRVIRHHSTGTPRTVKVSERLMWRTPSLPFCPCSKNGTDERYHCEPVQTLFPSELSTNLSEK